MHQLLVLEKYTQLFRYYYPAFRASWQKYGRPLLKTLLIALRWLGFLVGIHQFSVRSVQTTVREGHSQLRGNYEGAEFRIKNKVIPYSSTDTVAQRGL